MKTVILNRERGFGLKENNATIGTFTHILKDENHRGQLAGKFLKFENALCNKAWWDEYYFDLDEFRELRNKCCHTEKFEWNHVEKLLENLKHCIKYE